MQIIDENKNESTVENKTEQSEIYNRMEQNQTRGKFFGGAIVVAIGCIFLAKEMGFYFPHWLFSWPMLLIAIGAYTGIKNGFQNAGWLIMILIGSAFLLRNFIPFHLTHYLWPVGLIILGIYLMMRPRNNNWQNRKAWNKINYKQDQSNEYSSSSSQSQSASYAASSLSDEYIDSSAVFGSVKKFVISKNFKGGEVNCVFGGGEINMTQADFNGIIQLELNAVFGGIRLIVPSHWEIKSELTAVLGSVEDKRLMHKEVMSDSSKFLILKGTAVFGGIEILSY